jgi:outer membrane protein assembly factor BamA
MQPEAGPHRGRSSGGLSGFGPVVTPIHHTFFGGAIQLETPLLYTYKNYQVYELNVHVPARKSYFFFDGQYRSRPEDKFFGIGNETPLSNESFFKTVHREVAAGYSAEINTQLRATVGISFDRVGVSDPQSGESAQEMFTGDEVPGLFTGATMRRATLVLDHNTQDDLHRATRGGREIVEVGLHESIGNGDFAFWRYGIDLVRYFPLSQDSRKVIAFRGMVETDQEKGGSSVPFYDLPYIGSWKTLRGFEDYRYRDKSAVAFGLEYRYESGAPWIGHGL